MKAGEKKKKQKVTLNKVTSLASLKKIDSKKTIPSKKQQDLVPPKSYHSVNNSKGTGSSSTVQSSKFIQQSLRTSPKASLGQIKTLLTKKNHLDSKRLADGKKTPFEKKASEGTKNVKEEVKKSLANVIKVYYPQKKPYLDVSMTEVTSDGLKKQDKILRSDFNFISVVGEGGYGKVWKVEHTKTRVNYAMKEMSKALIVVKKSVDNVLNQMKILSKLNNSFIANMSCAFNDRDNLYLVMDYLQGGDLRNYLADSERLTQNQVKFIIACIIKALEFIHTNKIFHRDIKPENLVLDSKGYLRLTDFGIARSAKDKQNLDASGTPGYMAPEVICKQVHSFCVDYYAVGIICHELMLGKRPYYGQNRQQIRDAILSKQHALKKKDVPSGWSADSADFINKLIQRQPNARLGNKSGIKELIEHPWLKKYPWKQIAEKKMISPLQKKVTVTSATQKINEYDEAVNQFKILERAEQKKDIFGDYFCHFRQ